MNKDDRHRPQSCRDDLMGDASVINGAQPAANSRPKAEAPEGKS
jgi:hypothetical protein